MIEHESTVFQEVSEAVKAIWDTIHVTDMVYEEQAPTQFPTLSIVLSENQVAKEYATFSNLEQAVTEEYQFICFSNLATGAQMQTKEILQKADEVMQGLGFMRVQMQVLEVKDAPDIAKRKARYSKLNT